MDPLTAKPQLLKQANLALIRRAIKYKGTATRAEIAGETRISSTTVRSLLGEMMQNGEIESIGHDESSGGRKAERYRFRPDRYYGAVFCIMDGQVQSLLINICGEILESEQLEVPDGNFENAVTACLDKRIAEKEIKAVGVSVPGIVEGGAYWRRDENTGEMCQIKIGERLGQRYHLPVILENDLNAAAIGFGRCYQKEFPQEDPENINLAYLHFEKGCVSAGFLAGGKIIRGCRNYAGELGLIPMDGGGLLDAYMDEPVDGAQYARRVAKIVSWICGILNPKCVALAGPELRKDCAGPVSELLSHLLPKHMLAEILCSPDVLYDCREGMAALTAGKIFDEVQFIKE